MVLRHGNVKCVRVHSADGLDDGPWLGRGLVPLQVVLGLGGAAQRAARVGVQLVDVYVGPGTHTHTHRVDMQPLPSPHGDGHQRWP